MTHVKVLISALLLLCLAGRDAAAQDEPAGGAARGRGRVIGLLDLPEIVGHACGAAPPATADLYAAPSASASPLGSLSMHVTNRAPDGSTCDNATLVVRHHDGRVEPIPIRESGYEVPAAVVRARSGQWYRIDTRRGSAWIRRADPRHFLSYPDLLNDKLTYLPKGWNARLWRNPGQGTPVDVPAQWRDQHLQGAVTVEVLEVRRLGREPWVHVRLVPNSCGEAQPSMAPWTGWLPAYTRAGDTSLWFYSRGC